MDGVEQAAHAGEPESFAPLRTSVEKIADLAALIPSLEPEDEKQARLIQALMAIWPHVTTLLPHDPERLDELLLGLARYAIVVRSDTAETPTTIAELLGVDDERPFGADPE